MGEVGSSHSQWMGFQINSVPGTQVSRMGEYFALNRRRRTVLTGEAVSKHSFRAEGRVWRAVH